MVSFELKLVVSFESKKGVCIAVEVIFNQSDLPIIQIQETFQFMPL